MSDAGAGDSAACWICASADTRLWRAAIDRSLTAADLRVTDDRYGLTLALRRCRRCGFIFAPAARRQPLPTLYAQLVDGAYLESAPARTRQMRWLLDQALRVKPGAATLLDVGAGSGLLVAEAGRRGLAAVGVEPSRALVDSVRASRGVTLLQGVFPIAELAGRSFDLICLVDVLEHVTDPVSLLRDCTEALTPDGALLVVTPNVGSVVARLIGRGWWHFRLAHVGYFSRRSLERAARAAGLRPLARRTAKWFFSVEYLTTRVARYAPLGSLQRLLRAGSFRRLAQRVVGLNPRDSILVILGRDVTAGRRN